MKPIMITLMYLTFGGEIKLDTFEINSSCSSWFHHNVKVVENKKTTLLMLTVAGIAGIWIIDRIVGRASYKKYGKRLGE